MVKALLCTHHSHHKNRMNCIHVSACWTSLGQLARLRASERCWVHGNALMLDLLVHHTERIIEAGEFEARVIGNVAYGAACSSKAELPSLLFASLASAAEQRVSEFSSQHLAGTAWAKNWLDETPPYGEWVWRTYGDPGVNRPGATPQYPSYSAAIADCYPPASGPCNITVSRAFSDANMNFSNDRRTPGSSGWDLYYLPMPDEVKGKSFASGDKKEESLRKKSVTSNTSTII